MSKKFSFQDVKFRNEVKDTCENDLWNELSVYQKNRIREAQAEFNHGKGKPHKEVMKKYKKLLAK